MAVVLAVPDTSHADEKIQFTQIKVKHKIKILCISFEHYNCSRYCCGGQATGTAQQHKRKQTTFFFFFFFKNPAMTEMARGKKQKPFVITFMSHINYVAGRVAITTTSHIRQYWMIIENQSIRVGTYGKVAYMSVLSIQTIAVTNMFF